MSEPEHENESAEPSVAEASSEDEAREQAPVEPDDAESTAVEPPEDTFAAGSSRGESFDGALEEAPVPDTDELELVPKEPVDDEALEGDDNEERPGLEKAPPYVLGLGPLKSAVESLIFVSDKPLTERALADLAHATIAEIRMAAFELQKDYEGRGIELHLVAGGYQFRSAAKNAPFVRALVAPKPVRLSRALLETLSIVAYRQPVTRPEIDDVRGVDSGEALKGLADRELIRILGRKEEPGRPLLYGTTKHFLEFFGLNSLRDLPTLREYAELTDESRSIFERRMGEPLDLKGAQVQADEAIAKAHAEMLDKAPDDDEDGEHGEDASPDDAPEGHAPERTEDDETPAEKDDSEGTPAEDEE